MLAQPLRQPRGIGLGPQSGMQNGVVMVVGSSNWDLVARCPTFPRPGETRVGTGFGMFPGGKGANQAVAAAKLGGNVVFVGRTGADTFGQSIRSSMAAAGVRLDFLKEDPEVGTAVATIFVNAEGQNLIVIEAGANGQVSAQDVIEAAEATRPSVVLVQNEVPEDAVRAALQVDAFRIYNPAPARALPDGFFDGVDLLTPNETEAQAITGIEPSDDETCRAVCGRLLQMGARAVILTLGERGSWIQTPNSALRLASPRVQAVDATAAGDCFSGALAVFLAEGLSLVDAARRASAAAALSVTRAGAQPSLPTLSEVRQFAPELY